MLDVRDPPRNSAALADQDYITPERASAAPDALLLARDVDSVYKIKVNGGRFELNVPPPEWLRPCIQSLCKLCELDENWDSYGARRVHPHLVGTAIEVICAVLRPGMPLPHVAPTNRGGVLLEWHAGGVDLEIEVVALNRLHAVFEDVATGELAECDVQFDWSVLNQWIDRLPRENAIA